MTGLRTRIEAIVADLRASEIPGNQRIADRLTAALAEDAGGWRSMDSAPRDGTTVLISRCGRVALGWFCDDRYCRRRTPHWDGSDANTWGVRWAKATPPDGWRPLPDALPPPPPTEAAS